MFNMEENDMTSIEKFLEDVVEMRLNSNVSDDTKSTILENFRQGTNKDEVNCYLYNLGDIIDRYCDEERYGLALAHYAISLMCAGFELEIRDLKEGLSEDEWMKIGEHWNKMLEHSVPLEDVIYGTTD